MKVQCSILESPIRHLKESPVKHLQGNQLVPDLIYEYAYAVKFLSGIPSFYSSVQLDGLNLYRDPAGGIPLWAFCPGGITPLTDCQNSWTLFSARRDVYSGPANGISVPYTGVSSLEGIGLTPQIAGYPSTPFFDVWPYWNSDKPPQLYLVDGDTLVSGSEFTETSVINGGALFTSTLVGAVDPAPAYSKMKAAFLAQAFGVNGFPMGFKDYLPPAAGQSIGAPFPDPNSFDDSPTLGFNLGPIVPESFFPAGIQAASGWVINPLGTGMFVQRSQITYPDPGNAPDQYFFIGRWRSNEYRPWTAPVWRRRLEFVSDGWIKPGQTMGYGLIPNLPFPSSSPFGIASISGMPVTVDMYFAVVGQDYTGWLLQNGYKNGDFVGT